MSKRSGEIRTVTVKETKVNQRIDICADLKTGENITKEYILANPEDFISELIAGIPVDWGYAEYRADKTRVPNGIFRNVIYSPVDLAYELRQMQLIDPENFDIDIIETTEYSTEKTEEDAKNKLSKIKEEGFALDGEILLSKFGTVFLLVRVRKFCFRGQYWTGRWEKLI